MPSDPPNPPADGSLWFWHNTATETYKVKLGNGKVAQLAPATGIVLARKTADESVAASTTLQDDDELKFTIAANETWAFEGQVLVSGDIAGDIAIAFTVPAGATILWSGVGTGILPGSTDHTSLVAKEANASGTSITFGCLSTADPNYANILVRGIVVNGATAGTVQMQWAQRVSNATATIVLANSYLLATNPSGGGGGGGGGGGAALTVQEEDGAPIDTAVTILRVPNGALVDNGAGDVSLTFPAATTSAAGISELATAAEAAAGTDAGRVPSVSVLPVLIQDSKYNFAADSVGTDAYAITLVPAIAAYATGQVFHFTAGTANTGAATLNVNARGAKTIKKLRDQDLATGDIEAGQIVTVAYDGTNFQMQSQVALAPLQWKVKLLDTAVGTNKAVSWWHSGDTSPGFTKLIADLDTANGGAAQVYTVKKNGSSIGTITVAASGTTATTTISSTTFAEGDKLTVDHTSGDSSGGAVEVTLR